MENNIKVKLFLTLILIHATAFANASPNSELIQYSLDTVFAENSVVVHMTDHGNEFDSDQFTYKARPADGIWVCDFGFASTNKPMISTKNELFKYSGVGVIKGEASETYSPVMLIGVRAKTDEECKQMFLELFSRDNYRKFFDVLLQSENENIVVVKYEISSLGIVPIQVAKFPKGAGNFSHPAVVNSLTRYNPPQSIFDQPMWPPDAIDSSQLDELWQALEDPEFDTQVRAAFDKLFDQIKFVGSGEKKMGATLKIDPKYLKGQEIEFSHSED